LMLALCGIFLIGMPAFCCLVILVGNCFRGAPKSEDKR
jgi:hypothetical protein